MASALDRKVLKADARKQIVDPAAKKPAAGNTSNGTPSNGTTQTKSQPAPRSTERKVKHPATKMDDVLKGSGFMLWLESIRAHSTEGSDAMATVATIVSTGIRKSSKVPFGIDRILVSRRMRRGINHLAALELETARMASAVANEYMRFFGDPESPNRAQRDEFMPGA